MGTHGLSVSLYGQDIRLFSVLPLTSCEELVSMEQTHSTLEFPYIYCILPYSIYIQVTRLVFSGCVLSAGSRLLVHVGRIIEELLPGLYSSF